MTAHEPKDILARPTKFRSSPTLQVRRISDLLGTKATAILVDEAKKRTLKGAWGLPGLETYLSQ